MKLVITGASSGIGRALASHFMSKGHLVWGIARSNQAQFVADSKGKFFASRCNVADWDNMQLAADEVRTAWGQIDCLITCAGQLGEVGLAVTRVPHRWSDTVRVNLDGTYYSIRAFHEALRQAGHRGKIVCFSGGGATNGRPFFSAYGVSKAAVVRLVETLAAELEDDNVDINAVAPGAINTRLLDEVLALGPTVVGKAEHEAAIKRKASGGDSIEKTIALVEWLTTAKSDRISGRLFSAQWDNWKELSAVSTELRNGDTFKLRRVLPGGDFWQAP